MSSVLGIDLSSHAIDLVKLDEQTNKATWRRVELPGKTAFDRLRNVRALMPAGLFYDDVYLAAIEAPFGRGQAGSVAKLSRVFGAVAACLPAGLQVWEVAPYEWRKGLGLPGNASKEACALKVIDLWDNIDLVAYCDGETQDTYDAFAVAYYSRELNQRGIEAA